MQPSARIGCLIAVAALMISSTASTFGQSGEPAFVAPPRTIADITAILDQQRPDPKVIEGIRRAAGASPPRGASGSALADFYHDRAQARGAIGLTSGAIADADMAVQAARGKVELVSLGRLLQLRGLLRVQAGETKKAVDIFLAMARELNVRGSQGWLFNAYRALVRLSIHQSDIRSAEAYAGRQQALLAQARSWPTYAIYRNSWEAFIEDSKGNISEAKGQYREAEVFYRRAEARQRAAADLAHKYPSRVPRDQMVGSADTIVLRIARVKARQGRLAEAEADVRRALLSRLKAQGKFSTQMPIFVATFAEMLTEQGRYPEAEQLARTQLEILQVIGVAREADNYAQALHQHASILNLQGRWQEAEKAYDELDNATRKWEPARKEALRLDTEYIYALYNTNNLSAGITAAERLVTRQKTRFGEKHPNTALAHGLLGIGYARAGRDADALREFRSAVPVLMARAHEGDDDNTTTSAAREQRTQIVVEAYIALLARAAPGTVADPAAESFRLVDVIRGQSVQNALTASSARSRAKTPALAELVRKAQDLEKQHGAQLGLLNNVLSLPPAERDDRVVKALQLDVDKMRAARDSTKREIAAKFPEYASLVDPSPPTVEDIRTVLRADVVFLSIYFGRDASFIWAVPKAGPVTFAPIAMSAGQLESKVKALRGALEPNASSIGEIPPFDLTLAHELYAQILKPVEAGWRPAKSLIVATNGALGLLPLGVLPTAPTALKSDAEPYFAGYRDVPWLYRTHAVSLVPSASALRILRQLPPGSKKREQVIGFGDPLFNKDQAVEAARSELPVEVAMSVRGLALKRRAAPQLSDAASAQIGLLPRLPDTTDELKSVALALEADPSKVLHLGVAANEEMVKKSNLSHYRIIVFATHGLVPGELDGLHQPALALSAPDVAGVKGDGLLTMEEILALKLDADWVVLSACNTGAGAGAEAASGLGRAFFYAGTRALLVTNWSVHSASARELVTDLFRRQAADARISRAEALRQAAVALLDGKGFSDAESKTLFSYAHPLFWAPYTIIGDGGGTAE